jgi:hypothetical protein
MSYPNWFDPTGWDETKHEEFKARIMAGCEDQTPEVQAQWSAIADALIVAADAFAFMVSDGLTQVIMQADPEADENNMYLTFRVYQRSSQ